MPAYKHERKEEWKTESIKIRKKEGMRERKPERMGKLARESF